MTLNERFYMALGRDLVTPAEHVCPGCEEPTFEPGYCHVCQRAEMELERKRRQRLTLADVCAGSPRLQSGVMPGQVLSIDGQGYIAEPEPEATPARGVSFSGILCFLGCVAFELWLLWEFRWFILGCIRIWTGGAE